MRDLTSNRIPIALALALVFSFTSAAAQATSEYEVITVDANAPSHPFPHFWEVMFGSGRAILSLTIVADAFPHGTTVEV